MTPPYTVTVQTPPRLARRRRAVRAWASGHARTPLSQFMPASPSVNPSPAKGAMSAPALPALRGGGATNPFLGPSGGPSPHGFPGRVPEGAVSPPGSGDLNA